MNAIGVVILILVAIGALAVLALGLELESCEKPVAALRWRTKASKRMRS